MRYLFVVAHPDDEVIAAGATIHKLSKQGNEVFMCVLNSVSDIRCNDSKLMMEEMEKSHRIVGISETMAGNFCTLHFNTIPQIELVKFIEEAIIKFTPDVIVTHHPSDLHNDHKQVSEACNVAARLAQRQIGDIKPIKALYYMEVMSSTDWGANTAIEAFLPDTYTEISEEDYNAKIAALEVYTEGAVLRPAPHPRSKEALNALAVKRGSEIGYKMAEAFKTVFKGEL